MKTIKSETKRLYNGDQLMERGQAFEVSDAKADQLVRIQGVAEYVEQTVNATNPNSEDYLGSDKSQQAAYRAVNDLLKAGFSEKQIIALAQFAATTLQDDEETSQENTSSDSGISGEQPESKAAPVDEAGTPVVTPSESPSAATSATDGENPNLGNPNPPALLEIDPGSKPVNSEAKPSSGEKDSTPADSRETKEFKTTSRRKTAAEKRAEAEAASQQDSEEENG